MSATEPVVLQLPVVIDAKVTLIRESDGAVATVTVGVANGRYPTREEIDAAVTKAVGAMPGLRLATKHEWFNAWMREQYGDRYENDEDDRPTVWATPGGDEWDQP